MVESIVSEPQWSAVLSDGTKYTRPLLGSEIVHDIAHLFNDGLGEVCMGLTFKTSLTDEELIERTRKSIARSRFTIPIIASEIVSDPDDAYKRSWVYTVATSQTILPWADESLTVRRGPFDTEDFITEMNLRRLPYKHSDGLEQHVHFYLLVGDNHLHALFMHGPHTLMDARPTLRVLNWVLQLIAYPPVEEIGSLEWGTEWHHLPVGPISATGGLREDWQTRGVELMQETGKLIMNPVPSHSLHPARETVQVTGKMIQIHDVIDAETSSRLLKAVKAHGFSVSHLADAALTLSIFAGNPVGPNPPEDTHYTLYPSVISQDRYLLPAHRGTSHFVAGLMLVPIQVLYSKIPWDVAPKDRLIAVMKIIKDQYDHYLQNSNLPHLLPMQLAFSPRRGPSKLPNPHTSIVTNLGALESFVKTKFDSGDSQPYPLLQVENLVFGHRLGWQNLMNHVWTMNSQIYLQVAASDVWEEAYLKEHLVELKRQLFLILEGAHTTE